MKISVLVHNLNRALALEKCLASVARQGYRPLEVVILDAGSSDESPTVIWKALRDMERSGIEAKCVTCPQTGVAASRNFAARHASGELLCFIDNDAAFESPDGLCHSVMSFIGNPHMGVISFQVLKADTGEIDPVGWVYRRPLAIWSGREFRTFILNGTGFCVRASAFWEVGGFWDHLQYSREEEDLGLGMVDKGWELLYSPAVSIRHYSEPKGRMSIAERRFTELRNGVQVLWRRMPIPLAVFAIAARACTMGLAARREEGSLRTLLGAVPQAWRDWRRSGLRRLPVTFKSAYKYATLHYAASGLLGQAARIHVESPAEAEP